MANVSKVLLAVNENHIYGSVVGTASRHVGIFQADERVDKSRA